MKIVSRESENIKKALAWVDKAPRLGYHQEAQFYMYDASSIRTKIGQLARMTKA